MKESKQIVKLSATLTKARVVSPVETKSQVSAVKVEKVEKPPQNPVATNHFRVSLEPCCSCKPHKTPKIRQASILATKVAQGNRML